MTAIPTSRLRVALASFALFALMCAAPLSAQEDAAPPPPSALRAEQVAELVAPIALYPDALLGQVLTASTSACPLAPAQPSTDMTGCRAQDSASSLPTMR